VAVSECGRRFGSSGRGGGGGWRYAAGIGRTRAGL